MRWLLVLLVILNVLLHLYHLNRPPPVTGEVAGLRAPSREPDITLLSETESLTRRELMQSVDSACLFLGGFDDESIALSINQRLLSLDIDSQVEPVDEAAGVDYWVYLPPLVSRQASLRQLRELQSRNIDSYVITVGELSNGISLGIFSRKDSAESVVNRLRGVDYEASIRELPRTHRRYWVKVGRSRQHLLSDSLLVELMRSFPELEHRQMPCSSIATSD